MKTKILKALTKLNWIDAVLWTVPALIVSISKLF